MSKGRNGGFAVDGTNGIDEMEAEKLTHNRGSKRDRRVVGLGKRGDDNFISGEVNTYPRCLHESLLNRAP